MKKILTIAGIIGAACFAHAELPSSVKVAERQHAENVEKIYKKAEAEVKKSRDILIKKLKAELKTQMSRNALDNVTALKDKITALSSTSGKPCVVDTSTLRQKTLSLKKNKQMYSNRSTKWSVIPQEFKEGLRYTQLEMRNPKDIKVNVLKAGTLFCAFSTYQNLHKSKMELLINDGWLQTPYTFKTSDGEPLLVLSKVVPQGEVVVPWVHPHGGSTVIFSVKN